MKSAIKSVMRFCIRAVLVFPILPVLYLLDPIYRIRIGTIHTQRFGQLAANADILLRSMALNGAPKRTMYFFFGWEPANKQLLNMWKRIRSFPVRYIESKLGSWVVFAWRPILKKTRFWEAAQDTGVEYYLYNHTQPVLSFTPEEEAKGQKLLAEMGVPEGAWFVCFHARDGEYFRQWRPELEEFWAETDFRSINVHNYVEAAELIAEKGGYAIRYGAFVGEPFPITDNPKIIDYASHHRDDFMDVYLVAKCRFFLGCCSGPLALASAFNVPTISVNHHPYNFGYYQTNQSGLDIFVQRHLVETLNPQELVPYWEAQERGYFVNWESNSSLHETDSMYEMLETSADDICDACKDMLDRLSNIEVPKEARMLQEIYAEKYLSAYPEYKDSANIGPRFAVKYKSLIAPDNSIETAAKNG